MASPHSYLDLLQENGGDLTPSLFPHLDDAALETFLIAKLADGYARANAHSDTLSVAQIDEAAMMWAYYVANLAVWQRMSATPATAQIDGEASRTYLASQIQTFKDLADSYFTRYESLLPSADAGSGLHILSGVPTRYGY